MEEREEEETAEAEEVNRTPRYGVPFCALAEGELEVREPPQSGLGAAASAVDPGTDLPRLMQEIRDLPWLPLMYPPLGRILSVCCDWRVAEGLLGVLVVDRVGEEWVEPVVHPGGRRT